MWAENEQHESRITLSPPSGSKMQNMESGLDPMTRLQQGISAPLIKCRLDHGPDPNFLWSGFGLKAILTPGLTSYSMILYLCECNALLQSSSSGTDNHVVKLVQLELMTTFVVSLYSGQ